MIQLMQSLPTLDYTALFDERMQQKLLLARLRYKAQNKLQYANADSTYRRLVNIPDKDKEEYAKIIGEIPPFLELDTLLPIAATAQVENTLQ